MNPTQARRLQAQLDRPLDDLMAELLLYAPAAKGPGDVWARLVDPLQRRVCQEWDWCNVRQDARFENDYDIAVALFAILAGHTLTIPVDTTLITAILVKRGLDTFCGCP
jgi:hypothetical protein